MKANCKVSIIVPIYNVAPFLDKLICSLIEQSYRNIEIILVEDGSPDNSAEICDKYARLDNRIVVIHKSNAGGCEARNSGLDIASGEFIMFVDGDDWLSLDCVEYLLNIAIQTDSEMALSDHHFTTRDQKQIKKDNIQCWTSEEAVSAILYPRFAVGCWNKIYSLDMVRRNNLRFDVPWSGEGMYFASMAASYSNHVGVGHKKVYHYRMNNETSAMTKYNVQIGINALYNIKNIKKKISTRTPKVMHAIDWHIWKNYNFLLRLIIATNSKKKYWKEYLTCLFMIRWLLPKAVLGTEFSRQEKIQFVKRAINPVKYAKALTAQQMEALKNDKFK